MPQLYYILTASDETKIDQLHDIIRVILRTTVDLVYFNQKG